jgi:hypothetical protein
MVCTAQALGPRKTYEVERRKPAQKILALHRSYSNHDHPVNSNMPSHLRLGRQSQDHFDMLDEYAQSQVCSLCTTSTIRLMPVQDLANTTVVRQDCVAHWRSSF